uniref:Uncharacterized protein n=1 Tax=Arundo donax TaxID=35708 RepID=A0A0A9HLX4_ARUDO
MKSCYAFLNLLSFRFCKV